MKNKLGFTIIELLVVIILIAIITLASGIGLTQMLEREKGKEYDKFVNKLETAACSYADALTYTPSSQRINSVSIETLINEGYLDKELVNPKTNDKLENDKNVCKNSRVTVTWSSNGLKTCKCE